MICKGLERNKFSPEEAKEKLQEFVDLDLLDEDHQEIVESLISEAEEENYYWEIVERESNRRNEDYDELDDLISEADEIFADEESYED